MTDTAAGVVAGCGSTGWYSCLIWVERHAVDVAAGVQIFAD